MRSKTRIASVLMLAAAISLAMPGGLCASVLDAGDTLYKPGEGLGTPVYDTALPGWADGTALVTTLNSAFTDVQPGGDNFAGTLTSTVYRDPSTSYLLFVYNIVMDDLSTGELVRLTLNGYEAINVTGAIGADATGSSGTGDPSPDWTDGDPNFIERSLDEDTIGIQFRTSDFIGAALAGGDYSSLIFFETEAYLYTRNTAQAIDGTVGIADALVPMIGDLQVPVPSSIALALLGAVGAIGTLVKRRK